MCIMAWYILFQYENNVLKTYFRSILAFNMVSLVQPKQMVCPWKTRLWLTNSRNLVTAHMWWENGIWDSSKRNILQHTEALTLSSVCVHFKENRSNTQSERIFWFLQNVSGYYNAAEDYFTHILCDGDCGVDLHDDMANANEFRGRYSAHIFGERAERLIHEHGQNHKEKVHIH